MLIIQSICVQNLISYANEPVNLQPSSWLHHWLGFFALGASIAILCWCVTSSKPCSRSPTCMHFRSWFYVQAQSYLCSTTIFIIAFSADFSVKMIRLHQPGKKNEQSSTPSCKVLISHERICFVNLVIFTARRYCNVLVANPAVQAFLCVQIKYAWHFLTWRLKIPIQNKLKNFVNLCAGQFHYMACKTVVRMLRMVMKSCTNWIGRYFVSAESLALTPIV